MANAASEWIRPGCDQAHSTVAARIGLRLLEREHAEEAARVAVLRQAADGGWSDLASGRYHDVDDESLDDFVGQLGDRAGEPQAAG